MRSGCTARLTLLTISDSIAARGFAIHRETGEWWTLPVQPKFGIVTRRLDEQISFVPYRS